ncbi:MAG: SET domain-containing protein-lysine N-methyltransferase [Planctomycetia bacterium]|nr:SET domain-containing protein-lysine N-methyltransferase [Planctomycetia bacterium]
MTTVEASPVDVREGPLGLEVFARIDSPAGSLLSRCGGTVSRERTRHSVQIDHDQHLDLDPPLRYLNHCCEPNCGLLIRRGQCAIELYALCAIRAGQELTVDYATFEYEIGFMPGPCLCGAPCCRGRVTGFKDLPSDRIAAYGIYIAEHLRELVPAAPRSA